MDDSITNKNTRQWKQHQRQLQEQQQRAASTQYTNLLDQHFDPSHENIMSALPNKNQTTTTNLPIKDTNMSEFSTQNEVTFQTMKPKPIKRTPTNPSPYQDLRLRRGERGGGGPGRGDLTGRGRHRIGRMGNLRLDNLKQAPTTNMTRNNNNHHHDSNYDQNQRNNSNAPPAPEDDVHDTEFMDEAMVEETVAEDSSNKRKLSIEADNEEREYPTPSTSEPTPPEVSTTGVEDTTTDTSTNNSPASVPVPEPETATIPTKNTPVPVPVQIPQPGPATNHTSVGRNKNINESKRNVQLRPTKAIDEFCIADILSGIIQQMRQIDPSAYIKSHNKSNAPHIDSHETIPTDDDTMSWYVEDPHTVPIGDHGRLYCRLTFVTNMKFEAIKNNKKFRLWILQEGLFFDRSELQTTRPKQVGFFDKGLPHSTRLAFFNSMLEQTVKMSRPYQLLSQPVHANDPGKAKSFAYV